MRGKYVIAGIGHTEFGKLGLDTVTLNVQACRAALQDAGVEKGAVDGLFLKVPTSSKEILYGQKVAEALGLQPRWGGAWDQGGAANITLIDMAMMAIETGQCEVALVSYADNPRSGSRQAYARPRGNDAVALSDTEVYVLSREQFNVLAEDHKKLAFNLMKAIARALAVRLRHADSELTILQEY